MLRIWLAQSIRECEEHKVSPDRELVAIICCNLQGEDKMCDNYMTGTREWRNHEELGMRESQLWFKTIINLEVDKRSWKRRKQREAIAGISEEYNLKTD